MVMSNAEKQKLYRSRHRIVPKEELFELREALASQSLRGLNRYAVSVHKDGDNYSTVYFRTLNELKKFVKEMKDVIEGL